MGWDGEVQKDGWPGSMWWKCGRNAEELSGRIRMSRAMKGIGHGWKGKMSPGSHLGYDPVVSNTKKQDTKCGASTIKDFILVIYLDVVAEGVISYVVVGDFHLYESLSSQCGIVVVINVVRSMCRFRYIICGWRLLSRVVSMVKSFGELCD
jgi:hypothetical protein